MSVWNDILSVPENLEKVVAAQQKQATLEKAAALIRKAGRVIYAGVGSGMNACIPASYYLMQEGFPSEVMDATEATYDLFPGLKNAVLVLNTRSGETVELVRLAEQALASGLTTIAVTNEVNSRVAHIADICVSTFSRWDDLVVISAYHGMLATELLLASYVVGKFPAMVAELTRAANTIDSVLQSVIKQRSGLLALTKDSRPIYLLGRGASLASAHGGALVIEETSRTPVVPMATGLFRQGPIEVVDDKFCAIMFEGKGESGILNLRLAEKLPALGARIIWVGQSEVPGVLNVAMPDFPAYVLPVFEILPCQVLAHDLAQAGGIQPGTVRHIQKVITTEEGIPNVHP